jgi:glycosyltransferase involved in cell wall biosynthesis
MISACDLPWSGVRSRRQDGRRPRIRLRSQPFEQCPLQGTARYMNDFTAGPAKPKVAVIYDGFPHYRKGVIEELAASENFEYYFFGDAVYRDKSIKLYEFRPGINVVRTHGFSLGRFYFQPGLLGALTGKGVTHCIFLGNPWFISYWMLPPILKLLGKRVYFWCHGWIAEREPFLRRALKSLFFSSADGLFLYGHRAKAIGCSRGFRPERLHVINNSLDYKRQKCVFESLAHIPPGALRQELQLPPRCQIIICTARLTSACRFDLLIRAAAKLKSQGMDVFLVFVGDGSEKDSLATLAASLGVAHRFWGACYDETTLAKLYKASDLTVSPGKVGLTAMHSMAYGTPVISHNTFDHQMPEVEAILPGVTGDYFTEGSREDLARVIAKWFDTHPAKPERECIDRVEAEFTPAFQRQVIESALFSQ